MIISRNNKNYLKEISREELEIFVSNDAMIEENLRTRLFLLAGCHDFGGSDGMNGVCVDCYYDHPDLHQRCCIFQNSLLNYIRKNNKSKNKES